MRGGATGASVALAVTLAFTLSACAPPRALESESGLLIPVAGEDNGMEALLTGVLIRTAEGCLAVAEPESALDYRVVAPPATRLLADDVIDMPEYGELRLGDEVAFGGGWQSPDSEALAADIPEACVAGDEIFFINAQS